MSTQTAIQEININIGKIFTVLNAQGARFDHLDERFDRLEERITSLEERMTSLEERITSLEERMTSLEERITNLEERMFSLEQKHEDLNVLFISFQQETKENFRYLMIVVAELKDGISDFRDEMEDLREEMSQRMDERYDSLQDQITALKGTMETRFDQSDKRFTGFEITVKNILINHSDRLVRIEKITLK
jgi:chromosome segregation ATPase